MEIYSVTNYFLLFIILQQPLYFILPHNFQETLLEIGKALKEKGIITVTVLEEKHVIENKEILEKSFNTIFPVTKKDDI